MGLRAALDLDPRLRVVIDTSSPQVALQLARDQPIDVAIIDLVLPGMTGSELATALRRLQPNVCVLGLSMLDEPMRIAEMLRAGAAGFVHKSQLPEAILEAVHAVLGGIRYLPPNAATDDIDRLLSGTAAWPLERLTSREREVFVLMVGGNTNDDIAARLFIARRTVETHRYHVMHKLEARSIVDLVRIALRHGIDVT
ncbi:MAG: response regulator transcription factor [Deltaproteobacteria bacterium]|nr:response regulator transcription factor [Deltaproteobacteria bacterium]